MHANVRQEVEASGHWLVSQIRVWALVSACKQALQTQLWPEGKQSLGDMPGRGILGIFTGAFLAVASPPSACHPSSGSSTGENIRSFRLKEQLVDCRDFSTHFSMGTTSILSTWVICMALGSRVDEWADNTNCTINHSSVAMRIPWPFPCC